MSVSISFFQEECGYSSDLFNLSNELSISVLYINISLNAIRNIGICNFGSYMFYIDCTKSDKILSGNASIGIL